MPDLLGYDRRTVKSKLAEHFLATALSAGASNLYNKTLSLFNSRAAMPAFRAGRRRVYSRSKYRRGRRGRRFAKRVVGKRRGRRYTGQYAKANLKLDTNLRRNDYRNLRVVARLGQVTLAEGILLNNTSRFALHLDHWTTQFTREIEAYSQFKFAKVQFVLTPRGVVTGATAINVAQGQIPYLAVREVNARDPIVALLDMDELRNTPGVRFIPIQKKSRTVMNAKPAIALQNSVENETGALIATVRYRSMPWMDISVDTKALDLTAYEITVPQLDTTDGDSLRWDVSVYATLMLRGNKTELIPPIS